MYHPVKQLSDTWWELRKGRVTATMVAGVCNHSPFEGPKEIRARMQREKDYTPADYQRIRNGMTDALKKEDEVRKWYEETYGVEVQKTGIMIPEWEERLCASSDGLVGEDGMIEIKRPRRFPRIRGHRIPPQYFDQIQVNLAVYDREWCDFVVWSDDGYWTLRRIFRKRDYFNGVLLPQIKEFLENLALE